MRVFNMSLRGRCAIAAAAQAGRSELLSVARRLVRDLRKEDACWATSWSTLLLAGIASCEGDQRRSARCLEMAVRQFEGCQMLLAANAARHRLGRVVGGEKGRDMIAAADSWMCGQTIVDPDRMTALLAPGKYGSLPTLP